MGNALDLYLSRPVSPPSHSRFIHSLAPAGVIPVSDQMMPAEKRSFTEPPFEIAFVVVLPCVTDAVT